MRLISTSLLALAIGASACGSQPDTAASRTKAPAADQPGAAAADSPTASEPPMDAQPTPQHPSQPQGGYELLGIVDPGINNMVAFALKKPRGWRAQQSFTRQWKGSAPYNQIYIKLQSPDGADQIEYLPSTAYFYTDGPMARQMRQTAAQYGMHQPPTPGELAPMPALAYLRQVLVPQLAQHGIQLRATGAHEEPHQQQGAVTTSEAYLDGTLANGNHARLGCLLTLNTTNMNGEMYYQWEVMPSLIQSRHDVAAAAAHAKVATKSVTVNPAWAQQNQQLVSNGGRINQEINQRNYEIQRDAQRHQQETYAAIQRDRQASADRRAAAFGDALTGQARYDDPTTGERVRTEDYNHVYRDRQGNYYGTNTPIDAGQVDWQELQKVALKDY